MTKVQSIIAEIRELDPEELGLVLQEILARIDRVKQTEKALEKYIGTGQGVWEMDAQDYVNSLRKEDRA